MGFFSKKEKKKIEKHQSLAFWFSIPANIILGIICFLTLIILLVNGVFEKEVLAVFTIGVIIAFSILSRAKISRLRVLIHELRHAILVLITGNNLKHVTVGEYEGEVGYEMYENKVQVGPLITLAPYCFPIFSIPTLAACIILEGDYRIILAFALGVALGLDISTALDEIHPGQTDFKKVIGGFFMSALFIVSFGFFWTSFCFLWVVGGRNAYLNAATTAYQIADATRNYLVEEYLEKNKGDEK